MRYTTKLRNHQISIDGLSLTSKFWIILKIFEKVSVNWRLVIISLQFHRTHQVGQTQHYKYIIDSTRLWNYLFWPKHKNLYKLIVIKTNLQFENVKIEFIWKSMCTWTFPSNTHVLGYNMFVGVPKEIVSDNFQIN